MSNQRREPSRKNSFKCDNELLLSCGRSCSFRVQTIGSGIYILNHAHENPVLKFIAVGYVINNMALKSYARSLSDTSDGDDSISVSRSNLFADISRLYAVGTVGTVRNRRAEVMTILKMNSARLILKPFHHPSEKIYTIVWEILRYTCLP